MTPVSLREIDYFELAQEMSLKGFRVSQVAASDPEVYRWEFSDEMTDTHVWIYPFNKEVLVIEGLAEEKLPEQESFDHVPTTSQTKFARYWRLYEILRRFAYSGDELI